MQRSSISITGWLTEPTVRLIELVSFPTATVLIAGFIITLTYCLFVIDKPVNTWLATSIGAIYLGVTLGQVVSLRFLPNGFWYVLFGLLGDVGQRFGRLFRGRLLGQTQAVAAAEPQEDLGRHDRRLDRGLAGRRLSGRGACRWASARSSAPSWAFMAGVLALFGDLSISMIKRQVGVKDTGTFFLGHGGMLDRLDSLLFTLPFIYQALFFFAKNAVGMSGLSGDVS